MYNHTAIIKALTAEIGFAKSPVRYIMPSLLQSNSGKTYNMIHPLLTYTNLEAAVEEIDPMDVEPYAPATTYAAGDVTRHTDNELYMAKETATGVWDSAKWEKTDALNIMLKQVSEEAAAELVDTLMVRKKLAGTSKTLLEKLALYQGVGNIGSTIVKQSRMVGWMIDTKGLQDMIVKIRSVGLQLTQPNPELKLYVYHTSKTQPLKIITLTNAGSNLFRWHELDSENVILDSITEDTGGSYMICYRESELVGAAIAKTDYDWRETPCISCSTYNVQAHQKWSRYIDIHPFTVPESAITGDELWDVELNQYHYKTNMGLNLVMSVECDVTDAVVRHAPVFRHALGINVATKLLHLMANNIVNSGDAEKARQRARYELDNRDNRTDGMLKIREEALSALDFDMSSLNSVCFPRSRPSITKGVM